MFMDTPYKFEVLFKLLWGPDLTTVSGMHLINDLSSGDKHTVLQLALQTTLGDKIKELAYDRFGNILDEAKIGDATISVHFRSP